MTQQKQCLKPQNNNSSYNMTKSKRIIQAYDSDYTSEPKWSLICVCYMSNITSYKLPGEAAEFQSPRYFWSDIQLSPVLALSVTQRNVFWRGSLSPESVAWRVRERTRTGLTCYYEHEVGMLEDGERTVGSHAVVP